MIRIGVALAIRFAIKHPGLKDGQILNLSVSDYFLRSIYIFLTKYTRCFKHFAQYSNSKKPLVRLISLAKKYRATNDQRFSQGTAPVKGEIAEGLKGSGNEIECATRLISATWSRFCVARCVGYLQEQMLVLENVALLIQREPSNARSAYSSKNKPRHPRRGKTSTQGLRGGTKVSNSTEYS